MEPFFLLLIWKYFECWNAENILQVPKIPNLSHFSNFEKAFPKSMSFGMYCYSLVL